MYFSMFYKIIKVAFTIFLLQHLFFLSGYPKGPKHSLTQPILPFVGGGCCGNNIKNFFAVKIPNVFRLLTPKKSRGTIPIEMNTFITQTFCIIVRFDC